MNNNLRGDKTSEQKCKAKTIIKVDSKAYNQDENYSKKIDNILNKIID